MRGVLLASAALWLALGTGCGKAQSKGGGKKDPEVIVAHPTIQTVTDYEEFIGRMEPFASVDLRSRVTGYLDKAPFKEGSDVEKGELVGEIDPRTYKAELQKTEANLVQAEAHFRRLTLDYQRASVLVTRRVIGREEADKIAGDRAEAEAAVGSTKASLEVAKVNLSYTQIKAPFAGRISRRFVDEGNLIKADETILTSIVALDPIYAFFDVDERTLLKLRRLLQKKEITSTRDTKTPLDLGLADEEGYSLKGQIDFVDNKLDPSTGTLRVRVVVKNKIGESKIAGNKQWFLAPGMFVRLRLPVGAPRPALLVPEQALGTDQGQKFLYVLNDKDEVVYLKVLVGSLHGQLRAVKPFDPKGSLSPTDRVIVTGLQRVRTGLKVVPKTSGDDKVTAGDKVTR